MPIIPPRLKKGDHIRVIAPSRSMAIISDENMEIAKKRFMDLGLDISLSKNGYVKDDFLSSSIEQRIEDLHDGFSDPDVDAIFAIIGGFNSNQLLDYIDYDLIASNPKIFCGYSDITALSNAIYAKTGLITYSGPAFSTFAMKKHFDYNMKYFKRCLISDESFEVKPSPDWSDDARYIDQENRNIMENEGFRIVNHGNAKGTIIGGNQCTFNLLQGTKFMPDISDSILFLEDDYEAHISTIDRDLQSIIHQPNFDKVKGIVFGRFEPATKMTRNLFAQIIRSKKELANIPVIGNVDFGHTNPLITFPIGGTASLDISDGDAKLNILEH